MTALFHPIVVQAFLWILLFWLLAAVTKWTVEARQALSEQPRYRRGRRRRLRVRS